MASRGLAMAAQRARMVARPQPLAPPLCRAEGIEVSGAWLDNGLLHIDLVRPQVESRVRTVEIRSGSTVPSKRAPIGSGS